MVLIGRREAFAKLRTDRALAALISVLFEPNGSIESPARISQTDDAIVASLFSIQTRKEEEFRKAGEMLSRRKIGVESDWVHDDLLAFSVIVGNLCFGGCDKLIDDLLRARLSGVDDDRSQKVTQSMRALANSRNDAPILVILVVGRLLAYPNDGLDGVLLSNAYAQSSALEIDPATNGFLRILGERVADIVTSIGAIDHASEFSQLKEFLTKFERRAAIFAHIIFLLMLLITAALWLFVANLYFSSDQEAEELGGKLFQMGVVVGPIALLFVRKRILAYVRSLFFRILGGGGMIGNNRAK